MHTWKDIEYFQQPNFLGPDLQHIPEQFQLLQDLGLSHK